MAMASSCTSDVPKMTAAMSGLHWAGRNLAGAGSPGTDPDRPFRATDTEGAG